MLAFAACYSAPERAPVDDAPSPLPARVRRLSNHELAGVARALAPDVVVTLPSEPNVDGYDNQDESLVVTGPKLDALVELADAVAASVARGFVCAASEPRERCLSAFAERLALRLYGRRLSTDERSRLALLDASTQAASSEPFDGPRVVAKAMFLSPHTLYRTELGPEGALPSPDAADPSTSLVRLEPHELASAISFLFTGARPTAELLASAERGELDGSRGRERAARDLLATADGRREVERLVRAWLGVTDLSELYKLPEAHPAFSMALRDDMDRELSRFIDATIHGGDGTLRALFATPRAFPTAILGAVYGADLLAPPDAAAGTPTDPTFRRGIVSLAGFLAVHATADATNPVDRGLVVRARMFCDDFAAPPIAAQMLTIDPLDAAKTTREKFEVHGKDPACAGCHAAIDAAGFGLEGYDSMGRRREREYGRPVDTSGELIGTDVAGPFRGAGELGQKLAESDDVRRCFARQVYRFASGRREASSSDVRELAEGLAAGRATDALVRYVVSDSFVWRRPQP